MKVYLVSLLLFFTSLAINAQIDNKKKSVSIPAVEDKNDSLDASPITPSNPINNSNIGFNTPKVSPNLELPKKEFSMFPEEQFGNPGELYTKRLDKIQKDLLPEGNGDNAGFKEDVYWGDYYTKSEYIDISYRDYGQIDGDILHVLVDDDIVRANEGLSGNFSGFRLRLKEGPNKIQFYAVNDGLIMPNTAEYRIIDQWSYLITGKIWALSEGVKVTIVIVKESD